MFRLQEGNLPEDPKFSANLKELGFFINDAGQFRMIDYPDKDFQFRYSNNERANELRREAYQICQRKEVADRVSALGLVNLYLPQLTTTKPDNEASVPILAPPPEILKTRKRVIVLVNDSLQDLGILAYRRLQRELGVNGGSVVNFAKELIKRSSDEEDDLDGLFDDGFSVKNTSKNTPGLVVLNCGQLLYSYKYGEAKTVRSWNGMPRASACHDTIQIHPANKIKGNHDAAEHIRFVFENVVNNKEFVAENADVYVIAIENGAETLLNILDTDFRKYGSKIAAVALIDSHVSPSQLSNLELKTYLRRRARQWKIDSSSNDPRECIEMPATYSQEAEILDSVLKDRSNAQPAESVNGKSYEKDLTFHAPQAEEVEAAPGKSEDYDPICPTFADDENPFSAGECIFTAESVQHCILDFFDEVARKPALYHNPVFKIAAHEEVDEELQKLKSPDEPPVKIELKLKQAELEHMKAALRATPADKVELLVGRQGLEKRIAEKEEEVREWERKVLAVGGFKAGEAQEVRDNWKRVVGGKKVPFAGTMVDSELLKGAGLGDAFEDAMADLDLDGVQEM